MLASTGVFVIVAAFGVCLLARQVHPISFFTSLAGSWLVVGLGALVFVPLMMLLALSSGAYDPARDDGMTPDSVTWLWYRLWFFVGLFLVVSIPVIRFQFWSSPPTTH
jgi:hypothetical protein